MLFDRLPEIAGEYLKKGRPVYVEGRLKTRRWTDKDSVERYTIETLAKQMQLLSLRQEGGMERGAPAGGGEDDYGEMSAAAPRVLS